VLAITVSAASLSADRLLVVHEADRYDMFISLTLNSVRKDELRKQTFNCPYGDNLEWIDSKSTPI